MSNTIYQIYFNDAQKGRLNRFLMPYNNSDGVSPFFENDIILRLMAKGAHEGCDKFGVISWLFEHKIHVHGGWSNDRLNVMLKNHESYDILSVFGNHMMHNTLIHGGHGNLLPRLIERVLAKIGYMVDVSKFTPSMVVYMNFFFARPEIYEAYVREMLLPAMEIMCDQSDTETQEMVWADSKYKRSLMTKEERNRFMNMFGVEYYPNHTFVCERLFSVWLTFNKDKYTFKQMI